MRCLAKKRDDRFPTYGSLTRELQVFGSTATTPATLGLRFLAGVIDFLALGFLMTPFYFLLGFRTLEAPLELTILTCLVNVLYFSIFEGFWGASLGKAVWGLRVVGPERQAPGVSRALLRASVFFFAFTLPGLILSLALRPRSLELARSAGSTSILIVVGVLLQYGLVALLFSTARRRNGFAGVHELLSRTRVILRSAYEARPMSQMRHEIVASQAAARRIGPYEVLGSLTATQEHELLAGYDERLRRKVWINLMPTGSPAVTTSRRDLSRAGRLRWLSGKRIGEDCWDAYEAVEGKPLLAFSGEPQPWRTVRRWLYDLAEELHAALKDKSAPDLGLDRVWISADGRAKLLEWPAPGLDRSLQAVSSLTPHESCDLGSAQRFLYRVASWTLQGRMDETGKEGTNPPAVPLPLQATSFLKKLGAQGFQTSQLMMASLPSLVQTPAVVPRWKRCVQLALCMFYPLLAVIGAASMVLMLGRFHSQYPDLHALTVCLSRLEKMQRMQREHMGEEELRHEKAMQIYVAARFRKVLSDPSLQSDPIAQSLIPRARALAERLIAAHPNPTEEEIRESAAVLEPFLRNIQIGPQSQSFKVGVIMSALLPGLVLGLLSALLFRGGLVLRLLGIAVVTSSGSEVSRLRALWRSVIAWSPCTASVVITPFFLASSSLLLPAIGMFLAVSLIGIVAAAVTPARGLQDRLAGTYLVPR
jgi:uncharacterized RDD family membrane protein YckC